MSLFQDAAEYIQEKKKRATSGDRDNLVDTALGYTGAAGSVVGDAIGVITEPVFGPLSQLPMVQQGTEYMTEKLSPYMQELQQEYPLGMQRATDVLDTLNIVPVARAVPRLPKNAQMLSQNIPNQLPGFYSGGIKRFKAAGKGIAKGLSNYLRQSTSAQGMADFNQNRISKTLRDISEGKGVLEAGSKRERYGQAAHENLIATQYGNLSPVLKELDDEYFVHKGVLNTDDFRVGTGLPDHIAQPFFRTILSNWKAKGDGSVLMVTRKNRYGAENSGNIAYDIFGRGKSKSFNMVKKAFTGGQRFRDAEDFINSYEVARSWSQGRMPEMTTAQKQSLMMAWRRDPELMSNSSSSELYENWKKTLPAKQQAGVKPASMFKAMDRFSGKSTFETNDELEKALIKSGIPKDRILRNSDQKNDPDIYISDSVVSSDQALGGVNIVYRVGKDGKVTAVVSDDYDLFGQRGPMSKKLITVMEPMTVDVAKIPDMKKPAGKSTPPRGVERLYDRIQDRPTPTGADRREALANQASLGLFTAAGAREEYQEED